MIAFAAICQSAPLAFCHIPLVGARPSHALAFGSKLWQLRSPPRPRAPRTRWPLAATLAARPPTMAMAPRPVREIGVYSGKNKTGIEPWTWAWSAKDKVTGVPGHVRLNLPRDTAKREKKLVCGKFA